MKARPVWVLARMWIRESDGEECWVWVWWVVFLDVLSVVVCGCLALLGVVWFL